MAGEEKLHHFTENELFQEAFTLINWHHGSNMLLWCTVGSVAPPCSSIFREEIEEHGANVILHVVDC